MAAPVRIRLSPRAIKGRIVVADDLHEIVAFTEEVLKAEGYAVAVAKDGEEALHRISDFYPDLVILDLMLPKVHGMDVLKRLNARQDGSHDQVAPGVIICSAKSFKPELDQARELGAVDFLSKPFTKKQLMEKVGTFFARRPGAARETPQPVADVPVPKPYLPKLDTSRGYWRLWGTRGSTPVTGPRYARHGGNTACLEIRSGKELVVIDAGSGIRDLGAELIKHPRRIHLLIGHTHWDHIQGFPFFAPAYIPGFDLQIYGASGFGKDLASIFRGQLDRDYFPVELEDMASQMEFHHLQQNPLVIGDIRIYWEFMNHPGATVGFRIETENARIGYITDNEFLSGYLGDPRELGVDSPTLLPFRKIIDFVTGADLLISEAQYPNEEYAKKIGWGHSSLSNACLLVKLAGVRRWIVTHHDPAHDDEALDRKLNLTRQILKSLEHSCEVIHAHDGMNQMM